jgi:hypothetical protein
MDSDRLDRWRSDVYFVGSGRKRFRQIYICGWALAPLQMLCTCFQAEDCLGSSPSTGSEGWIV